ncbi:MAG: hypothetical protein JXB49_25745 [Bacteroidales bacterium]|nr:hypothetical protein [Bacteroidales bacterium]
MEKRKERGGEREKGRMGERNSMSLRAGLEANNSDTKIPVQNSNWSLYD